MTDTPTLLSHPGAHNSVNLVNIKIFIKNEIQIFRFILLVPSTVHVSQRRLLRRYRCSVGTSNTRLPVQPRGTLLLCLTAVPLCRWVFGNQIWSSTTASLRATAVMESARLCRLWQKWATWRNKIIIINFIGYRRYTHESSQITRDSLDLLRNK